MLTGNAASADDLVQDTLERGWTGLASWQSGTDMRAWLFSIMHNVRIDQLRRNPAQVEEFSAETHAGAVQDDATVRLQLRDMETALRLLPEDQRTLLLLVGLEELTNRRRASPPTPRKTQRAAVAHAVYSPALRRPVKIGALQEDQLVTWLSKRLGSGVRPAHLGKLGYDLIGGRLLPGDSGPVLQFMYQDQAGRRLTLYVYNDHTRNQDTGFRFAREGRVNVFYWIDGKFGYALSASADKGELARVAAAVYQQLDNSAARPEPITDR